MPLEPLIKISALAGGLLLIQSAAIAAFFAKGKGMFHKGKVATNKYYLL